MQCLHFPPCKADPWETVPPSLAPKMAKNEKQRLLGSSHCCALHPPLLSRCQTLLQLGRPLLGLLPPGMLLGQQRLGLPRLLRRPRQLRQLPLQRSHLRGVELGLGCR